MECPFVFSLLYLREPHEDIKIGLSVGLRPYRLVRNTLTAGLYHYGVIPFLRTIFPAQLGGLIAPLPHHSAKKPSLVPLCVKMAAHIASSAVKRQGRLRSSALSQSALAP
jgi:hypothetical protein